MSIKPAFTIYNFQYITLLGRVEIKKLSSKSQYHPDLSIPFDYENLIKHSQTGDVYGIAELGDIIELYDRLKKYDRIDIPLNNDVANIAIDYFMDKIGPCKFLDHDEAFSRLNLGSALGYGAKLEGLFSRKDPGLRQYLNDYVSACQISPRSVFINASQKDEIRPLDQKTQKLKTPRLFTSFPVEHTYLCTIALGSFLDQFYEHRFCLDGSISAVGDPMQDGALAVYKYELDKRPYLYCTDTSGQDSSVSADFITLIYSKIMKKYNLSQEEALIFESCRNNSVNKVVSVCGMLYLVPRGLGSGDYLTVVINIMWRLYMILENYKYPLDTYFLDNTTIINGDDLVLSSNYDDLDLSSKYATIEWKGKHVTWSEMDFCSCLFHPYIHHHPEKVEAVLKLRKQRKYMDDPVAEMQVLGGLLRVLTNEDLHLKITKMMMKLRDEHDLFDLYDSLYIDYGDLFALYNYPMELH